MTAPTPEKLSAAEWLKSEAADNFTGDGLPELLDEYAAYCVSQATADKDAEIAELKDRLFHTSESLGWHIGEHNRLTQAVAERDKKIAELEERDYQSGEDWRGLNKACDILRAENASLRKQLACPHTFLFQNAELKIKTCAACDLKLPAEQLEGE